MTKRGYAPSFAVGTVAASGTLGIMIPPSITLCFFGILTETSIVQLLMAGILPGIVLSLMIIIFIIIRVRINPKLINWVKEPEIELTSNSKADFATAREIVGTAKKLAFEETGINITANGRQQQTRKEAGFLTILPALILIFVVLGSMYFGFATPMEAAGYGVIGALVITIAQRRITRKIFFEVLSGTARTGAMMIFLILCGYILTYCVSYLGIAQGISDAITKSGLNKYVVLVLLYILWFILGCLMDPSSVVILTVPFLFKPLRDLGFNELWIGIMTVIASQIGMITPPIGMNLFVLKANTDLQMKDIISGSIPYVLLLLIAMLLFTLIPDLTTLLPRLMF
jgi:tripartite ATP-independent transporter DctM subunit